MCKIILYKKVTLYRMGKQKFSILAYFVFEQHAAARNMNINHFLP